MDSFLSACIAGRFDEVKNILDSEVEKRKHLLNLKDSYGSNCLLWAIEHLDVEAVKYLLTFPELDMNIKDHGGSTALLMAVMPRPVLETTRTIEIIKMLCEMPGDDLINQCSRHGSVLQCAVRWQSLEVIKELIKLGANVNYCGPEGNVLHTAASRMELDILRYLLDETDCDLYARDPTGWLPCSLFMVGLLHQDIWTSHEHFQFGLDFISRSHNPLRLAESFDVGCLLLHYFKCQNFREEEEEEFLGPTAKMHFREVVKFLCVSHPRKRLMEKIMAAEIENSFCLIFLLLLEHFKQNLSNIPIKKMFKTWCIMDLEILKLCFLEELFPLFVKDEALAKEYVAEVARIGWRFCNSGIILKLFLSTTEKPPVVIMRNFEKTLLRYGFDIAGMGEQGRLSMSRMCRHMSFLVDPDDPSSDLAMQLGSEDYGCVNAFTESDRWLLEHYRIFSGQTAKPEPSSLQNLSRFALRTHAFQNHKPEEAMEFLNSCNIPHIFG